MSNKIFLSSFQFPARIIIWGIESIIFGLIIIGENEHLIWRFRPVEVIVM